MRTSPLNGRLVKHVEDAGKLHQSALSGGAGRPLPHLLLECAQRHGVRGRRAPGQPLLFAVNGAGTGHVDYGWLRFTTSMIVGLPYPLIAIGNGRPG